MQDTVFLGVKVTPEQMEMIREVARNQGGSSLSAAIRRILDDWQRAQGQVARALVDTPVRYEVGQGDECDALAVKAQG